MVEYVAKKGKYEFMEKNYDAGKEFDDIALEYDEDLKELAGFLGNDIEKFAEYKVHPGKNMNRDCFRTSPSLLRRVD